MPLLHNNSASQRIFFFWIVLCLFDKKPKNIIHHFKILLQITNFLWNSWKKHSIHCFCHVFNLSFSFSHTISCSFIHNSEHKVRLCGLHDRPKYIDLLALFFFYYICFSQTISTSYLNKLRKTYTHHSWWWLHIFTVRCHNLTLCAYHNKCHRHIHKTNRPLIYINRETYMTTVSLNGIWNSFKNDQNGK